MKKSAESLNLRNRYFPNLFFLASHLTFSWPCKVSPSTGVLRLCFSGDCASLFQWEKIRYLIKGVMEETWAGESPFSVSFPTFFGSWCLQNTEPYENHSDTDQLLLLINLPQQTLVTTPSSMLCQLSALHCFSMFQKFAKDLLAVFYSPLFLLQQANFNL